MPALLSVADRNRLTDEADAILSAVKLDERERAIAEMQLGCKIGVRYTVAQIAQIVRGQESDIAQILEDARWRLGQERLAALEAIGDALSGAYAKPE